MSDRSDAGDRAGGRGSGRSADRGQAYTIEGVLGGFVILIAVLFALQSVVVSPTTGGSVNTEVKADLRQQASDALVTAAQNDSFDLSAMVRYWDQGNRTFRGALNPEVGYGRAPPPANVGTLLEEGFTARGWTYNLRLRYLGAENGSGADGEPETMPVVYRGEPSDDAVAASYRVTLYDNQSLTTAGPETRSPELWQIDTEPTDGDDGYYPIPNAVEGPVYNVVEVRVIVW